MLGCEDVVEKEVGECTDVGVGVGPNVFDVLSELEEMVEAGDLKEGQPGILGVGEQPFNPELLLFFGIKHVLSVMMDNIIKSHPPSLDGGPGPAILQRIYLLLRPQNLERAGQIFLYLHHGAAVVELPTIVRGRENGHQLLLVEELIPVFHNLVGPANQIQIVLLQEGTHHFPSKHVANPSLRLAPHLHH